MEQNLILTNISQLSPHTDGVVLVDEEDPASRVVVEGGDGASVACEVLQTALGSLRLAAAGHLGHLDGEGAGGGGAAGPEVSGEDVALRRGVEIHVEAGVSPTDDRGSCRRENSQKYPQTTWLGWADSHFPPGAVTENWSVLQAPRLLADPAAAVEGPTVTVSAVTGSFNTKVSKSSLS